MQGWSTIGEWADAYIRVHEASASLQESHPDLLAAYEFMDELVGTIAEECWSGIIAVVERRPSERVLGMLAAGPVEDLLHYSGANFIDRIEERSRLDPLFRQMLHGVWKSGSTEVWTRFEAARGVDTDAA